MLTRCDTCISSGLLWGDGFFSSCVTFSCFLARLLLWLGCQTSSFALWGAGRFAFLSILTLVLGMQVCYLGTVRSNARFSGWVGAQAGVVTLHCGAKPFLRAQPTPCELRVSGPATRSQLWVGAWFPLRQMLRHLPLSVPSPAGTGQSSTERCGRPALCLYSSPLSDTPSYEL